MSELPKVTLPTQLLMEEVERLIGQGRTVTLTVRGNSMLPLVRNGDRAVLAPPQAPTVKRGAVVLARTTDGQVVLHRILRLPGADGNTIVLQGDGNIGLREETTPEGVIGVMTHVHRGQRQYACDSPGWCFLSKVWQVLRPLRRGLLGVIPTTTHKPYSITNRQIV